MEWFFSDYEPLPKDGLTYLGIWKEQFCLFNFVKKEDSFLIHPFPSHHDLYLRREYNTKDLNYLTCWCEIGRPIAPDRKFLETEMKKFRYKKPIRLWKILKINFTTMKKVFESSDEDLMKLPGFGKECLKDLTELFKKNGYEWPRRQE